MPNIFKLLPNLDTLVMCYELSNLRVICLLRLYFLKFQVNEGDSGALKPSVCFDYNWFGLFIDNANNLVFWCRFLNKLEPWYAVYIMQQ